ERYAAAASAVTCGSASDVGSGFASDVGSGLSRTYVGPPEGGPHEADEGGPHEQADRGFREANGRITLLVSHRFSTVRMANLIVVLDGAHVVEAGAHEALMAKGGQYAEL